MQTNFFSHIADLNLQGTFKVIITNNGSGTLTVSEMFTAACGDKAAALVIPLSLTGTPQELDEAFFERIAEPAQKAAGLYSTLDEHIRSMEAAKAASKLEQDRKQKESKQADDKKKAYDAALKEVSELAAQTLYEDALAMLPDAADYPDKEAELKNKRAELLRNKELKNQVKLF